MKKMISALMACMMITCFAGCGTNQSTAEEPEVTEKTETMEETIPEEAEVKTLVVYFSCTGHTKDIAEKIAKITDADLYEIKAAQEYTSEDLNWHDSSTRATLEQNDPSARPEIGSEPLDLSGYTAVYAGYPIWWGEEPRIMDTFVESYDFTGMTMIPFCTSGSSPAGNSGKNLSENAGSGNWFEAARFAPGTSEEELRTWIDSLQ